MEDNLILNTSSRDGSPIVKPMELNFIHLSDIHFKREISGTVYDIDQDIREQLIIDAQGMRKKFESITGVLVTGDIAFAGKENEYETALDWLRTLCDRVDCSLEEVWVVPGNHDVDRGVITKSSAIQDRHDKFRRIDPSEIDLELQRYMSDESARESIFEPLKNYNTFAKVFSCQISADVPVWHDDLKLNDGSILRLRGLNSTLISNSFDDDAANKLILGSIQAAAPTEDGVEYLTLCHHPPQWLRDQDEIERYLDTRVKVQLFGHKHRFRVDQKRYTVQVSAGAMHPDRREPNWQPRYNILSMVINNEADVRRLEVNIHPRVWHDSEKIFVAEACRNDSLFYDCTFDLKPWAPPVGLENAQPVIAENGIESASSEVSSDLGAREEHPMNRVRRIAYRFYTLPYNIRLRVAQDLDLVRDEDRDVPDTKLFDRYFKRAQEKRLLERLWGEVENAHHDNRFTENPFAGE